METQILRSKSTIEALRAARVTGGTVDVPSRLSEDSDDGLAATAADVAELLDCETWEITTAWDDDRQRDAVRVTVAAAV